VKVGVQATLADVKRALRPLLPLTDSAIVDTTSDPLSALALRLEEDGVDPTSIRRAIARFKADHSMGFEIDEDSPLIETESVYGEEFND